MFPNIKNISYVHCPDFLTKIYEDKINLFSRERFSNVSSDKAIDTRENIADRLHIVYPNANIIIVLRKKESWLKSLYNTYIVMGGVLSFDDWYSNIFNDSALDFDSYVGYLEKVFNEVYVCWLEELEKDSHSFIKNMCDFIGCDVPEYKDIVKNESISSLQLEVVRNLNKLFISKFNKSGFIPYGRPFRPYKICIFKK